MTIHYFAVVNCRPVSCYFMVTHSFPGKKLAPDSHFLWSPVTYKYTCSWDLHCFTNDLGFNPKGKFSPFIQSGQENRRNRLSAKLLEKKYQSNTQNVGHSMITNCRTRSCQGSCVFGTCLLRPALGHKKSQARPFPPLCGFKPECQMATSDWQNQIHFWYPHCKRWGDATWSLSPCHTRRSWDNQTSIHLQCPPPPRDLFPSSCIVLIFTVLDQNVLLLGPYTMWSILIILPSRPASVLCLGEGLDTRELAAC